MTNNESAGGIVKISDTILKVLPPAFSLLIIINIMFMGSVIWFINHNAEQRNELLSKIVDQCLLKKSKS